MAAHYRRSLRPPQVRAHSRQKRTHDKLPVADRRAKWATPVDLHRRKCQQFWFEHSQIPRARIRAAVFISSLKAGRAFLRRSAPSRGFARRSSRGNSSSPVGAASFTASILTFPCSRCQLRTYPSPRVAFMVESLEQSPSVFRKNRDVGFAGAPPHNSVEMPARTNQD